MNKDQGIKRPVGRPRLPGGGRVTVNICVPVELRELLRDLGQSAWVVQKLREEKERLEEEARQASIEESQKP